MAVNKITPCITQTAQSATSGLAKLGQGIQKKGSFLNKANNFVEGRGINPGRGAFLTLIYLCTLTPRLLKARDNDERMEILRRDFITITTICFAMKALKAGSCKLMAKKSGLPLTKSTMPKNTNPLKKALGYFQQKGETAFSAEEITANYTNINGKETLTKFLDFVDKNNGNVGKVLTFDKAKPHSLSSKRRQDGALTKAAKKLLGNDFDFKKPNNEIIDEIKKINSDAEGFSAISEVLKDNDTNPISKFAKGIGAKFETASLAAVTAFLGFGLPKLNEKLTKDKYFNGTGGELKTQYQNPNYPMPVYSVYNAMNNYEKNVFQNFLGSAQINSQAK